MRANCRQISGTTRRKQPFNDVSMTFRTWEGLCSSEIEGDGQCCDSDLALELK